MNLGLYVCSFFFHRAKIGKKEPCYLKLNEEIECGDNSYSNAENFFLDFFNEYAQDQEEDTERVYYIEREDGWRNETKDFVYLMARVRSGMLGVEADIYDKKKQKTVGKRNVDQADVMPFLIFIAIPKPVGYGDSDCVKKGIILFQSNGVYGVKSKTVQLINSFAREKMGAGFYTRNVAPGAFLDQFFRIGTLKKIHLIKTKMSADDSDTIKGKFYGREEKIVSNFVGNAMEKVVDKLKTFGLNPKAVYEWDASEIYQDVKVTVEIDRGITRTIDLHRFDNRSILEYIPDTYKKGNGHANEATIIPYLIERVDSYLQQMSVTIK